MRIDLRQQQECRETPQRNTIENLYVVAVCSVNRTHVRFIQFTWL